MVEDPNVRSDLKVCVSLIRLCRFLCLTYKICWRLLTVCCSEYLPVSVLESSCLYQISRVCFVITIFYK